MNKKIWISLILIIGLGVYFITKPTDNLQDEEVNLVTLKNPKSKFKKASAQVTHSAQGHKNKDQDKDKKDVSNNHNTIHDNKLDIKDFIIAIDKNENTDSLKGILTQFSTIDLENTTLKDLTRKFDKIDIETELTVDRNESTGNLFYLKSKSNIPGTRYLHGQIVGEGPKKFIQHLSFEYKSESKSFNEAVTVAQSLIGSDQKPSVISENYIQWKISETHILWVKKQSKDELLNDPIYPHTEEDLGTCKIAIEQEIH